jgi:predicted metal-dependent phosphoesterase TrpH
MSFYGKIALHMHTTVSDGTDSPEEILLHVKEKGIKIFSVSDHDAIKGCSMVKAALKEGDPVFIPGVEFSSRDDMGKYHILGYGYRLDAAPIKDLADYCHELRLTKIKGRISFLEREYGFTFAKEDIDEILALDNPGKPHLGNLMVKYGYAKTKEEAINGYINNAWLKSKYIAPETAIKAILDSGGVPVLAHPVYGSGDQIIVGDEMDERLRHLIDRGLKGVEAFYSGFSIRLIKEMLYFAERYGLYVTAGSDYHGTNKLVELGDTGFDPGIEAPEGMKRFFSDVL